MSEKQYDIAIVGATGAVGSAIINLLEQRQFPVRTLYPLNRKSSESKQVMFHNRPVSVIPSEDFDFTKAQIAFFSAGSEVSRQYVPKAQAAGCIVIDNTAEFRQEDDIPLVIPEVNPARIADYRYQGIIANPNCSTIQMLVALKPLYDAAGITRINVATYQSVSGTGKAAIEELVQQLSLLLNGQPIESKVYPKQIAFNVLPHVDDFDDNGYSKEEMKMWHETQKIFEDPSIRVNATAVRVPVLYGHSEAIHLETQQKLSVDDARSLLSSAPGVILMEEGEYPTPIPEASETDAVYVGRVREDISHPLGLNLWVVSDNIRKGAALNAVQIAELLITDYLAN